MRSILLLLIISILNACASVQVKPIFPETVALSPKQLETLNSLKQKDGNFAFTLSSNGEKADFRKGEAKEDALRRSLSLCAIKSNSACRILVVGNQDYQERYREFNRESATAIRSLREPTQDSQFAETMDWQIDEPDAPRTLNEGIHFATPTTLKDIKNISSKQLVAALKEGTVTLIDAGNIDLDNGRTLPNAHLIDWIGVSTVAHPLKAGEDSYSPAALEAVMKTLAPQKDQAIVVFCTSPDCWLSVNGLMRLRQLGFTNLHWYRAGFEVWRALGLPTVKPVPYASVRYYEASASPQKAN